MVAQQSKSKPSALQQTPIAIIGMSALFAKAKNLQQFWKNILNKTNCITEVPEANWSIEDYYDPDPTTPDKTYTKWGGFLPKIDFDPLEFGLPPDTLEAIDSANLLSLVMAKQALADAGYGKKEFNRETTGVILGASGFWKSTIPLISRLQYPLWEKILNNSGLSETQTEKIIAKMKASYVPWSENSFPGILPNVVAGRITNRLDLGGTNCVVDAACASSLSALKMAVSELIEGRCDMMLTGGFDTENSILSYMCFSKTPAFSKKDHLNPFDATSDGMMVGEGLGMLVIKRLADAERDGDRIYAVIKGIGTGSDGRYKSIYAPRPEGQIRTLQRAYEDAGFSPATVGLMEAHGTGTPAGDRCEFTALERVFSESKTERQKIALGSVKSQIGHTKAAAGSAGLIKAALALHHKILPPTINVTQPNPQFKIEESSFHLNTETRPWIPEGKTPRRAGVSAFGFGGTDYHVVLEEYTPQFPKESDRLHSVAQSILLWADTLELLGQKCQATLDQLQSQTGTEEYKRLQNQSNTAVIPIQAARVGFIATSLAEAQKFLKAALKQFQLQPQAEAWEHPHGIYYRQTGLSAKEKVVALFPGQGSQYLNMGREIALNFPEVQQAYQAVDKISNVVFPVPAFTPETTEQQLQLLQCTENAQPAIGAFSQGLYKILQQVGFKPDFIAGHSFGELTALWAAGVFNDDDYRYLIKARGQAMAIPQEINSCDRGTMLAVIGNVAKIEQIISGMTKVQIANYNAPEQVVLSGSKPEIATLEKVLPKQGYTVTPLPVSAAFHTPFVNHASQPFSEALDRITFQTPKIPVYANMTGSLYPTEASGMRSLLEDQLLNAVQFVQEVENLYAQGGYCFVEIGPRQILTNLVRQTLGDRPHLAVALNPSRQKDSDLQLRQGVMQLRVLGLPLKAFDTSSLSVTASKKPGLSIQLDANNYIGQKTKAAFDLALKPEPIVQSTATFSRETSFDAPIALNSLGEASLDYSEHLSKQQLQSMDNLHSSEDAFNDKQTKLIDVESGLPSTDLLTDKVASTAVSSNNNFESQLNQQLQQHDQVILEVSQSNCTKTFNHSSQPKVTPHKDQVAFDNKFNDQSTVLQDELADMNKSTSNHVIDLFQQFYDYQKEVLKIHEQYVNIQSQNFQTFLQLLQQKNINVTENLTPSVPLLEVVTPESRTSNPPKVIISPVVQPVETKLDPIAPQAESPQQVEVKPTSQAVHISQNSIASQAESSQQVEVKPTSQAVHISQIANYLESHNSIAEVEPTPTITETAPSATHTSSMSAALLEVVSDKTGYPSEMLELEMDLEADLGIDSIKRVEIMGSLQNSFPQLPKLSPEELADKRTLAQIVQYLDEQMMVTEKKIA